MEEPFPELCAVVLDTSDVRATAEFYRRLLGYVYRAGDEQGVGREEGWLVLLDRDRRPRMAFQEVPDLPVPTWPTGPVPQQLHLDFIVGSVDELVRHGRRALELGGRLLEDRTDDPQEALQVLADPAGHPFCILVSPPLTGL